MRQAIVRGLYGARTTPRALIDDALLAFERAVAQRLGEGVRPALLFGERDRILRELRAFIESPLAARLRALPRARIAAAGPAAAPFDAIVRNARGVSYAIVLRRMPRDGLRLDLLQRIVAAKTTTRMPVDGILVYDFSRAAVRLLSGQAGAQRVHCDLRAS